MKIPQAFLSSLISYFEQMAQRGKIPRSDFEILAMTLFSSAFGYTFLNASFEEKLTEVGREDFIKKTVAAFLYGITAE